LREAQLQPERLESGVRKWLTYIALLLTAGAMICDLIWFVDYFLAGELTSRFLLKALTVMLICGTIFAYYLGSLRWDRNTNVGHASARSLRFAIGSLPAVVVSFSIGLGIAGTPSKQRGLEADNKRIQDLRGIAFAMNSWHTRTQWQVPRPPLPQSLSELIGKGVLASQILDPETRAPYEYSIQSGRIYELCATFSSATEANQIPRTRFWQHGAGRACFTLNASQPAAW
jgi:hypothetical protein